MDCINIDSNIDNIEKHFDLYYNNEIEQVNSTKNSIIEIFKREDLNYFCSDFIRYWQSNNFIPKMRTYYGIFNSLYLINEEFDLKNGMEILRGVSWAKKDEILAMMAFVKLSEFSVIINSRRAELISYSFDVP
jgi:hypothetical protein